MSQQGYSLEMPAVVEEADELFADLLPQVGAASATRLSPVVDEKKLAQEMPLVVEAPKKDFKVPSIVDMDAKEEFIAGKYVREVNSHEAKLLKRMAMPAFINFAEGIEYPTPDTDYMLERGVLSVRDEFILFYEIPGTNALFLEIEAKDVLYDLPEDLENGSLVKLSKDNTKDLDVPVVSYRPLRYFLVKGVNSSEEQDIFAESFAKERKNKMRGLEQ